jgi:hypothetical protein
MAICNKCGEKAAAWENVCFACRSEEAQEKFTEEEEMDDGQDEDLGREE